jgi:hypothetical protein
MSHPRNYVVVLIDCRGLLTHLCAAGLSLAEAAAWLEAHRRAPSPDATPCILLQPLPAAFRLADSQSPST